MSVDIDIESSQYGDKRWPLVWSLVSSSTHDGLKLRWSIRNRLLFVCGSVQRKPGDLNGWKQLTIIIASHAPDTCASTEIHMPSELGVSNMYMHYLFACRTHAGNLHVLVASLLFEASAWVVLGRVPSWRFLIGLPRRPSQALPEWCAISSLCVRFRETASLSPRRSPGGTSLGQVECDEIWTCSFPMIPIPGILQRNAQCNPKKTKRAILCRQIDFSHTFIWQYVCQPRV